MRMLFIRFMFLLSECFVYESRPPQAHLSLGSRTSPLEGLVGNTTIMIERSGPLAAKLECFSKPKLVSLSKALFISLVGLPMRAM